MTEIQIAEGQITTWEKGDFFTIKMPGNRFVFSFNPEVSAERTALLDAMQYRKKVKIILRVEGQE